MADCNCRACDQVFDRRHGWQIHCDQCRRKLECKRAVRRRPSPRFGYGTLSGHPNKYQISALFSKQSGKASRGVPRDDLPVSEVVCECAEPIDGDSIAALRHSLCSLGDTERLVVWLWMRGFNLPQIGREARRTKEGARQILNRALHQMLMDLAEMGGAT